ncbi:PspC domain-containing protein [Streptantibioticus silvisoli]|uniref:PspC domain-containing protein n=1 Tax=Streptantibioticus silvisoli TaxID=2705255 RepID=A0ABT6W5X4_9ACTN|nr:PspC domain-containing protein [Streptantibioticus silvisoli]MDI5966149.1 PspC domain-containing protein [Streptantibioticus silvisoli]
MTDDKPGPAAGADDAAGGAQDAPAAGPTVPGPSGPPESPDTPDTPARKLLTRSRRSKIIGGVCGGLGRYFGIDPVIFRVVLAVLALTGGVGLISYGIGWLLIPLDGEDETELRRLMSGRIEGTSMTAVLCALVGSGLFLSTMDNGETQAFALCLVGAMVAAVYWSQRRRAWLASVAADYAHAMRNRSGAAGAGPAREAPPAAQPPPKDGPSWWRTAAGPTMPGPNGPVSFTKTAPGVFITRPAGGGIGGGTGGQYVWGPEEPGPETEDAKAAGRSAASKRADRREREGGLYSAVVFLLSLLAGTGGAAVSWHRQPLGTSLEVGFVAMLAVLGLGMVGGSFAGRRGHGMIGWAVLASFLVAVSATMPKSVGTDWHRATWHPASAAAVRPSYALGAGQGVLDLTGVSPHGGTVTTSVDMGAGQIQVRVPRDVTVRLSAKVGLGDVRLPDERHHDVNVSPDKTREGTYPPAVGTKSAGTIKLTLKLGAGQVEVLRDPAS